MTIADQELEIRARERIAFYGGGERGFVFFVNDGLDGARGDEIVVDVFDAGFVEFGICFSEGEGVFEEEWLVGFAGREIEGRVKGMLEEELRMACVERGIDVMGRDVHMLRMHLNAWLRSREKVGVETLLLTR